MVAEAEAVAGAEAVAVVVADSQARELLKSVSHSKRESATAANHADSNTPKLKTKAPALLSFIHMMFCYSTLL